MCLLQLENLVQIYYGGIGGIKMKEFATKFITMLRSEQFSTARFAYSQEPAGWQYFPKTMHTRHTHRHQLNIICY